MKMWISLFLCLCSVCVAEIQWVSAAWWAAGVPESTKKLLERRFKTMSEIRRHEIDMAAGKAMLYWKPNIKYSDQTVKSLFGWAGIASYELRIKTRGVIEVRDKHILLISLGDGTEFPLYSQNQDLKLRPVLQQNELEPLLKLRLEAAAQNHQLVTIEGPLFWSLRPPVGIAVEQVSFDE